MEGRDESRPISLNCEVRLLLRIRLCALQRLP